MIKLISTPNGLNCVALIIFMAYFKLKNVKQLDYQEKGRTLIFPCLGLLLILLAAIPSRYGHSTGGFIFSDMFATLPFAIVAGVFIDGKADAFKNNKSYSETHAQLTPIRSIAAALENNDTTFLKELIKSKNLNVRGPKLWKDEDGLNYMQFVIKVRSNPLSFPFNDEVNITAVNILLTKGAASTPAISEGVKDLSEDVLKLLLKAGAESDVRGFVDAAPLIFEVIGDNSIKSDIAILLIQKGAHVNTIKDSTYTPIMYAAHRAGISANWKDTWRLVRYLLEDAHADYRYIAPNGLSFAGIIRNINQEAKQNNIVMPLDFKKIVIWLQERNTVTATITKLKIAI